jgi:hypothetical protein
MIYHTFFQFLLAALRALCHIQFTAGAKGPGESPKLPPYRKCKTPTSRMDVMAKAKKKKKAAKK